MIETGTVVGNVSRTHHPCGACGVLVENCAHWHPNTPAGVAAAKREANRRMRERTDVRR